MNFEDDGKQILKTKRPKVFLYYVKKRIEKNQNFIGVFNGGTGSGKSWACIKAAEDISEMFGTHFSIENNLAFSFTDILEKMKLKCNGKPGTVFVLEEVGAFGSGGSSREWQSQANKFFFSFLQTSRHRNQILLFNCPSFNYLEKGARELCHFQLEANGINYRKKVSIFKPFAIQCNRRTGKLYFKYLRYGSQTGRRKFGRIEFGLPQADALKIYEKEKRVFTTALNERILAQKDGKKKDPQAMGESMKNAIQNMTKKGFKTKLIAEMVERTQRTVQRHIKEISLKKNSFSTVSTRQAETT